MYGVPEPESEKKAGTEGLPVIAYDRLGCTHILVYVIIGLVDTTDPEEPTVTA